MKEVLIYRGPGVDVALRDMTVFSLSEVLPISYYTLRLVSSEEITDPAWQQSAALFVLPGGQDRQYVNALSQEGMQNLKSYVANGGRFLGLCAGAYFASAAIEFEKGTAHEICQPRELAFFPGKAIGQAYEMGQFLNGASSGKIVPVRWERNNQNSVHHVYFHGGCYFAPIENYPQVQLLASYRRLASYPPAIISCQVGAGRAVLSGIHPEVGAKSLEAINHDGAQYSPLISQLQKWEFQRRDLLRRILWELGIEHLLIA